MIKALVQALGRATAIASTAVLAAGLLSAPAHAAGFDLALSNTTANLSFILNPGFARPERAVSPYSSVNGAELHVGGFFDDEGTVLGHAMMMAGGLRRPGAGQYDLAAGFKLVGGDIDVDRDRMAANGRDDDKVDVGALALGLRGSFLIAPSRYNPVNLTVEGFLAPKITNFSDSERYIELATRLEVEIIPSARAYLGYRRMEFRTEQFGRFRVDRSMHLGVKLAF